MNKFYLEDCGVCSSWNPDVKCKKTGKLMKITITKCINDVNNYYLLDSTGLEEECITIDEPLELVKQEIENFLSENYTLIGSFVCTPFTMQRVLCPNCHDSIYPGL